MSLLPAKSKSNSMVINCTSKSARPVYSIIENKDHYFKSNTTIFSRYVLLVLLGTIIFSCGSSTDCNISIDASGNINNHADQIGIWVNSHADQYTLEYLNHLKDLNIKSIRQGWAYSVMDKSTPDKFYMSPCDLKVQAYISDSLCNLTEKMTLSDIEKLTYELGASGFAVLSTDGINYIGNEDTILTKMDREEREEYYLENAERWALWAKGNNFQYFELGNENDIPGEVVDGEVGTHWTPKAYGAFAKRMALRIKTVYPEAICGINGGFGKTPKLRDEWWDGILEGAPDINDYIDFVVIHRYAFGSFYKDWQPNTGEWGRVPQDMYSSLAENFPGKPVYITETSGFQVEEGVVPHYRGVMAVEMMGNILLDRQVELIHHWGTRWDDFLIFDVDSDSLNMMGNALKSYTKFMKNTLIASDTVSGLRYFAAKDTVDNSLTVWLVNHAEQDKKVDICIENFMASPKGELWKLTSPDNNPFATDNELKKYEDINIANGTFSALAPPISITVATFGAK